MARLRESDSDFLSGASSGAIGWREEEKGESSLRDYEEFQFGYSVSEKTFDAQARLSSQQLGRAVWLETWVVREGKEQRNCLRETMTSEQGSWDRAVRQVVYGQMLG